MIQRFAGSAKGAVGITLMRGLPGVSKEPGILLLGDSWRLL